MFGLFRNPRRNYLKRIQDALDQNKYEVVEALLAESKEFLLTEERISYELELKKQKNTKDITQAIEIYDEKTAKEKLEELKKLSNFTQTEKKGLEEKIYQITEEGLFEKIKKSKEKSALCEKFISIHSESTRRRQVIKFMLEERTNQFLNAIKNSESFDETHQKLEFLASNLEKYSREHIELIELTFEELNKSGEDYLKEIAKNKKMRIGTKVRITPKGEKETKYKDEYISQREGVIRGGSIGKVLGFTNNEAIVESEDIINENGWRESWSTIQEYWKKYGRKNIAEYKYSELEILDKITELQINKFRNGLKLLEKFFSENNNFPRIESQDYIKS